jgi:Tfp pilus assembly major pilin PilA
MTFIEISDDTGALTRVQQWSNYITILLIVVFMLLGVNARNSNLTATTSYTNVQAGIQVAYPENWLLDEDGNNYIFRVRDMTRVGFNTTIQIDVETVSENASGWNILTARSLAQAPNLSNYEIFSIESTILPNDTVAMEMTYTFTSISANPSLESLPIVVIGVDILTIRRGQAIILTFFTDAQSFDDDKVIFDRFINSLEFQ